MAKNFFAKMNFWQKNVLFFYIMATALLAVIILINLNVSSISQSYIFTNIEELPSSQTVLILGASVHSDQTLSDMLKDRADTAIELYRAGKARNFLVSGDNRVKNYNETSAIQKYLLEQGIEQDKIFLDYAGFDTYDSLYRARDIFKAESLIITTQDFHLPRAVYLGRQLGMEVYGFGADKHIYRNVWLNILREKLANVKAWMDINSGARPQFLGKVIPIQ
ncbi:MAG: ElyC/SanA/YdcF family protein [Candidatus Pacebacteria bacterium]|nr:ElyC/SanA/YdcF family protein [Candidatus Paceibacterota bacterium]